MVVDTSVLKDVGLTNAQIKIYVTLLELGESSSGNIIKRSSLQNSVVYNALNQLIKKGLVAFVLRGKIKHFSATNPDFLLKLLDDKREKITELIPKLVIKQELSKLRQEARVFLGWKGVYAAFNYILDTLSKGSDYIGFAAVFETEEKEEVKQFFREFQKKRDLMKYKIKLIVNESLRKQIKSYEYYSKFGKPEYRYVHELAPPGIIIFGDNILNVSFGENPIAIITTSKQIADSYKSFFNNMWGIAKP